ncbi:MAG: hypothetical protein HXX13_16210 [Bacteroidetes bacterium]|nr:hypothetical protein [Bacteroidota bacterium]
MKATRIIIAFFLFLMPFIMPVMANADTLATIDGNQPQAISKNGIILSKPENQPETTEAAPEVTFSYLRFNVNDYLEAPTADINELPTDTLLETLKFDVNYYVNKALEKEMELPQPEANQN